MKQTMGTVHTLSATSAEESFDQLQTCIRDASSYGIVVPQVHFLEEFLRFYPEFPRKNLYTPGSLLKACGLVPVPPEIALLSKNFDEFCDPSFSEFGNGDPGELPERQSHVSWNTVTKEIQPPFERCVLFGSFSQKQFRQITERLRCRECFVLQRIFSQNTSACELSNVHLYPHRNVAEGYAWIERMKTQHPNAFGVLLPTAEPLMTLFRKPSPKRALAQADWQEAGTIGSFWAYAQTQTDVEALRTLQRDCDAVFRDCQTEDFKILRERLLREGKSRFEPFVCCDWPASDTVGNYITLFQNAKPPSEFLNLSALQNCPLTVTKRAFFTFFRRILQFQAGFEDHVLSWEEAVYLPVRDGFIPQAIATNSQRDHLIVSWMREVSRRGGSLHLGVPLRDRNGEPLQPLWRNLLQSEATETSDLLPAERVVLREASTETNNETADPMADGRTYITVSNALSTVAGACEQYPKANILRFPGHIRGNGEVPPAVQMHPQAKNALRIPTELIRFSYKNWEWFYRCPRKTWLEEILKTVSVSMHPTVPKALFLGDSIHDNLIFSGQPHDLDEWRASIQQRSDDRWEKLRRYCPNVSLLYQRHQRALEYSFAMAAACEEFLHGDWQLYSEYDLPKKESLYTGRIDLLAVHEGKRKIFVIDYKSGNENFTPNGLQPGHGWQLLLYGRALQALYPTYEVHLRMILRTGETKTLPLDELSDVCAEINARIDAFRQSGVYEQLPEEQADTLPLAFGGKIRKY